MDNKAQYSLKQISIGFQIQNLTRKQYLLLGIVLRFYKSYTSVYPSQETLAKKASCSRMTVHRAFKKFEELGFFTIVSGLSEFNRTYRSSNQYFITEGFGEFVMAVKQIPKLLRYLKSRPKETASDGHFQRENVTPNVTRINTNLLSEDRYIYSKETVNVHNSHICKKDKINPYLEGVGLSYADKVFFSRYSDHVLGEAVDKMRYIERSYRIRNRGAYMNVACREIVKRMKRKRMA